VILTSTMSGTWLKTNVVLNNVNSTIILKFNPSGKIISQKVIAMDAQLAKTKTLSEKALLKLMVTMFRQGGRRLTLNSPVMNLIADDAVITINMIPQILSTSTFVGKQGILSLIKEFMSKFNISPRRLMNLLASQKLFPKIVASDNNNVYLTWNIKGQFFKQRLQQEDELQSFTLQFDHLSFDDKGLLKSADITFTRVVMPWDLKSNLPSVRARSTNTEAGDDELESELATSANAEENMESESESEMATGACGGGRVGYGYGALYPYGGYYGRGYRGFGVGVAVGYAPWWPYW